ncbi:MAG: hypothetical protein WCJ55_20010 [Chloroflexales bacterium]
MFGGSPFRVRTRPRTTTTGTSSAPRVMVTSAARSASVGLRLVAAGVSIPLTTEGAATWPAGAVRGFVAGAVQFTPAWGDAELAYVYWSAAKVAEGAGDLPSIGTCCPSIARRGQRRS